MLGHRILEKGIEVDRDKIEAIDVGIPQFQENCCTTNLTKNLESHPLDQHSSSKRIKTKTKSSKRDIPL